MLISCDSGTVPLSCEFRVQLPLWWKKIALESGDMLTRFLFIVPRQMRALRGFYLIWYRGMETVETGHDGSTKSRFRCFCLGWLKRSHPRWPHCTNSMLSEEWVCHWATEIQGRSCARDGTWLRLWGEGSPFYVQSIATFQGRQSALWS